MSEIIQPLTGEEAFAIVHKILGIVHDGLQSTAAISIEFGIISSQWKIDIQLSITSNEMKEMANHFNITYYFHQNKIVLTQLT